MTVVKADLHMHVNNNITRKVVTKILKESEKNGLKAIAMLEHTYINLYNENSVLNDIIQNEGIEEYYSGKVVSAVEVVCSAENLKDVSGKNINGKYLHIHIYDFDYKKLEQSDLFNEASLLDKFNQDVMIILNKLKELNLPAPNFDYFIYKNDAPLLNYTLGWKKPQVL